MNFDWSSVKYIFQVPLEWFKSIHRRVFNAYGSNFIVVKEGQYGGMEIGLDTDALNTQISVDLTGVVKSIDNATPDLYGNIQLSTLGVVKSVDEIEPDTDGNVELTGVVKKVNGHVPDISGNVWVAVGAVQSVDGHSPDTVGNVQLNAIRTINGRGPNSVGAISGFVETVNNIAPVNGNVTIDIPSLSNAVYSVNNINPTNGNVNLGDIVYSVNNVTPVNGNVTLDMPSSITMQDVETYVENQGFATETYVDTALTNYIDSTTLENTLQDYALTSDLDDYALTSDLENYVQTVDGIAPVNGAIDFGLTANKWMKTDGLGHIGVTDEQPVAISSTANGYLYANNGTLEFKTDEFVTLSTEQTISGKKTIVGNSFTIRDESLLLVDTQGSNGTSVNKNGVFVTDTTTGTGTTIAKNGILLDYSGAFVGLRTPNTTANDAFITLDQSDSNKLAFSSSNGIKGTSPYFEFKGLNNSNIYFTPDYGAIEIVPAVQAGVGGYIDFHLNGSSADYTSRIIETATGSAQVPNQLYVTSKGNTIVQTETSGNKVFLIADANNVALWNQPTDTSTNSLAVATVGYIQTKFQNAQTTNVNVVTGVTWNGTQIVIASQTLGFTNGLLTSVTNNATGYINTVAYAP